MPQDVNPLLDRLIEAFPACFSRSAPQPLKIGLGEELLALAGVHPALADLIRTQLRRALKVYTGSPAYRKALEQGGPRYDLDGQPAGEVTPEQQAFLSRPRPKTPPAPAARRPGTAPPPAPVTPLADLNVLLPELIAMAIPGKLDLTLKINQLPPAKPASPGTMLFAVQAEGRIVVVELKNKAWNTLKTAAESDPLWVAAISGKLGEAIEGGFRLENPAVQVFDRKPKPDAAAAPAPNPGEPAATAPEPSPSTGYAKMTLKGRATPKPGA